MWNPHNLRTLPIIHLVEVFKNFWDFIWLAYCLNRFITLRRWWHDFAKKSKSKNTKKFTRVRNMWEILTFFVSSQFSTSLHFLKSFWDFILLGYFLNRFFTLRRWSNDIRKHLDPKILKNSWGYEECEEFSHSSYPPNSPLVWSF